MEEAPVTKKPRIIPVAEHVLDRDGNDGDPVLRDGDQGDEGEGGLWKELFAAASQECFTLRLEHWPDGSHGNASLARFPGEERLVLFRSDRPGAIGKIVYSSSIIHPCSTNTSNDEKDEEEDHNNNHNKSISQLLAHAKIHVLTVQEAYRGRDLGGLLVTEALASLRHRYSRMTEATSSDGGRRRRNSSSDNGGSRTRAKEDESVTTEDDNNIGSESEQDDQPRQDQDHDSSPNEHRRRRRRHCRPPGATTIIILRCQLDAEEDIRRHNKLVRFYEHWGCRPKPHAKVTYLHNTNNGNDMYRKIPLQWTVRWNLTKRRNGGDGGPLLHHHSSCNYNNKHHHHHRCPCRRRRLPGRLVTHRHGPARAFVPITLCQAHGKRLEIVDRGSTSQNPHHHHHRPAPWQWLLLEHHNASSGLVEFRTTRGHYLRAEPSGACTIVNLERDEDKPDDDNNDDEQQQLSSPTTTDDLFSETNWSRFQMVRIPKVDDEQLEDNSVSSGGGPVEAQFMLRSYHGTFLSLDVSSQDSQAMFYCSSRPAFWHVGPADLTLTVSNETPRLRRQYRQFWIHQTVQYVSTMRERYLSFRLASMSLRAALDLVQTRPGYPFRLDNSNRPFISLRTRCFRTAELFRHAGHPDWVQLVALWYGLGEVIPCLERQNGAATVAAHHEYDWTLPCRTTVVGCLAPSDVVGSEFQSLNADQHDPRYNTAHGMYHESHLGLDHVWLAWTGPEYLYHMIRHNRIDFPEEGLKMLRLAALSEWHNKGNYSHLANADDDGEDAKAFCADFDDLIQLAEEEGSCWAGQDDMTTVECDKLWNNHYADIAAKYHAHGYLEW